MADDLFQDLPPPSVSQSQPQQNTQSSTNASTSSTKESVPILPPPAPVLKSALKRPKPPPESQPEAVVPEKRLRFKTTTDASEKQVIDAMQKIASHIKNPSKFNKASKLSIQLVQAGSIKHATADHFFAILEAAMSSLTTCNEPHLRADYHALFSAAQDVLNKKQKNLLSTWMIRAVWANDLFTDDSFVFSKSTGRIKEAISSLPVASENDDMEEAVALKEELEVPSSDGQTNDEEPDPFGLDALMPNASKKDDNSREKIEAVTNSRKAEEEENIIFLKSQREALMSCLEIAAKRYKTPWCQTAIDILAKHAFDNVSRFTTRQRDCRWETLDFYS
ncbi:hypothetical protein Fot_10686 [Forsythia ovata]|uniref:Uncharacterized protein n=1 Tax=Forsythia ovata TaxID=205694 RepID=A0ABD1WHY4_9LAMI